MTSAFFNSDPRPERDYLRKPAPAGPGVPRVTLARWLYWSRRVRPPTPFPGLFAEAAWDMLLDLYIQERLGTRVSVSSLCIAAHVPDTTALRYVALLVDAGWFQREEDFTDRRRVFVTLSREASENMDSYIDRIIYNLWNIVPEGIRNPQVEELAQVCRQLQDVVGDLKAELSELKAFLGASSHSGGDAT